MGFTVRVPAVASVLVSTLQQAACWFACCPDFILFFSFLFRLVTNPHSLFIIRRAMTTNQPVNQISFFSCSVDCTLPLELSHNTL